MSGLLKSLQILAQSAENVFEFGSGSENGDTVNRKQREDNLLRK
jgi:hypothetical protein